MYVLSSYVVYVRTKLNSMCRKHVKTQKNMLFYVKNLFIVQYTDKYIQL